MQVRGAGEALFIACDMERRAIRLYERALSIFADSSCREAVRAILTDERHHLARFSELGGETPGFERARLLSAQATGMLFSGGLMEAQRKGAFSSVGSLYQYAALQEKEAQARYSAFASSLQGSAAAAFAAIAMEEKQHQEKLSELLAGATENEKDTDEI